MTKQTFLHDKHVALGARMVDFAGWHMPVQYSSIIEEHKTVRENVGLFDVSHMGEMIVYGEDALPYLNKLVPQDITKLVDLKAAYCQLTNKQGGIIDDLIIYKLEDNKKSGCVARFKHGSIEYLLTGTMKQQDFEKILKNLVFPK